MVTKNVATVRSANDSDFEWVADLMDRTLRPFYGGDHRAHAQRIFDTHINGGVDHVGHFSSGQHMFIAEVEGERAGLIHVIDKKQATVKISPLIVLPDFRGYGIASLLLQHTEEYAIKNGARQLYCTVAAPNDKALGFFSSKGFRVTGTAQGHYKRGIDEHMLYKQLIDDSDLTAPNISVVPFCKEQHADSARALILAKMQSDFLGVDDSWVDALYAGYVRRDSADVNTKFKIIFVAERHGEVTGIVGATPKKGDPIKLMPLVASDEASFEALIIDLQGLLADYGHKLYVHLVPEAWQVACLQRHGWNLEGVFPGGYAPNSVVQQWGLNMRQGEDVIVRTMRIKRPYYDAIMRGDKTLEVRVGYESIKRYKAGELIQMETSQVSGIVRIKAVRDYESFHDALAVESWKHIVPDAPSEAIALRKLQEIYPSNKESLGVYVFEIEPVKKK